MLSPFLSAFRIQLMIQLVCRCKDITYTAKLIFSVEIFASISKMFAVISDINNLVKDTALSSAGGQDFACCI